jgi:isoleucyl-tRNA synthetase
MFKQLSDKLNYYELEKQILKFWDEQNIFEQSVSSREGRPRFTFYEGPPTANGRPGIHHVMSRTLKDLVCRYKTMRGFQVHRKGGWDTHGLPVEIEVEKMLGFKHKDEILTYGIAKFNEKCKESVWTYKADWERMTRMMGYWVDLRDAYITFTNEYIESVWWALKQYFDRGFISKGYKIQPYCPRCETTLSSHEVSLGYKEVRDLTAYVKMKQKGEGNTYFVAWTTQPWTLIPNVALVVHPDIDYVKVEYKGEKLILAESRLSILDGEYFVLEKLKGSSLAGLEYERVYSYHPVKEKGWYVVTGEFVSAEDGTGIVQISPTYGEDDYQTGMKYGLPLIHPVNKSGEFGPEVTDFPNMFVKAADPLIVENLKMRGLLLKKEHHQHSYPFCWRCDSHLLYYARESWFIRTTSYAAQMSELNRTINWIPPEVGEGRFGNWLEENKDWALSRDRFWGTPLPIWVCEKCGDQECVGSIQELREKGLRLAVGGSHGLEASQREPALDLHKPFVDEINWTCARCGGTKRRTPELIDVWFDSGSMPFAQWHYPFENRDVFEKAYPADFISEGIDQTRGWFYTLHSIGSFLFGKPAFKNVLVNELILDKQGQKMSKSKSNTVDPFELIERYGADAVRWYLVSNSPVWRPTLFDEEGIGEVQRKFFSTLLNTYAFFALYANIDRFAYEEKRIPVAERPEIDRWILSVLNSLVSNYEKWMDEYDVTRATRAVSDFTIDQLSNWYVRRNRRRFWKSEMGRDKTAAYQTLWECLTTVTKLTAPFAPFLSDELFRALNTGSQREALESVHLSLLPDAETHAVDAALERKMERAIRIVGLVRAMRMKSNIKVRQPLRKILIPVVGEQDRRDIGRMKEVILEEINVKSLEFVSDDSGIVRKKAKPNFKTLGPKFGKQVQAVASTIRELSGAQIQTLERDGKCRISVNGSDVVVSREDVEILHEDIHGWLVETDGVMTVALDTELSEDLIDEGFAREFVNRVQNMRKDAGFQVTDRIKVYHRCSERLMRALSKMQDYVKQETLATELLALDQKDRPPIKLMKEELNGEVAEIGVERVSRN